MKFIAFADSNLFLDAFLNRQPNDIDCITVLHLATSRKIKLFTSSSCLLTTMYFLKKNSISGQDIIAIISQLLEFISIKSPDEQTFVQGLSAGFNDLEDAVQYFTAMDVKGIDYFITSNTKDYKKATVQLPVVTPKQFLSHYNKKRS